MVCPFVGEHDEFDFEDDREDRDPKFPILISEKAAQGERPSKFDVIAAAEEVVANVADRVPLEGRKSLKEVLTESGATAATAGAAAWAIRAVVESRGFAGGGFFFNANTLFADTLQRRKLSPGGFMGVQSPGGGFF